ncbi:acyl carrier protein [Streptomyces sp. NPDC006458]|uniref:acyl carrier protein n=1 Tax=Streptomyces sp. NPDC006458 TaxID=3154302 RepID=UPI0033B2195C
MTDPVDAVVDPVVLDEQLLRPWFKKARNRGKGRTGIARPAPGNYCIRMNMVARVLEMTPSGDRGRDKCELRPRRMSRREYRKRWVFMGSQVIEEFTEERLKALLQSHFQIDPTKLDGSARFSELELDSIAVMELIVVIEEQTGVDVQESLLEQMNLDTTLAQAVQAVQQVLCTTEAAAKNDG